MMDFDSFIAFMLFLKEGKKPYVYQVGGKFEKQDITRWPFSMLVDYYDRKLVKKGMKEV